MKSNEAVSYDISRLKEDLDLYKVNGPDALPYVLEECTASHNMPPGKLLKNSLQEGSVPREWKKKIFASITKNGGRENVFI